MAIPHRTHRMLHGYRALRAAALALLALGGLACRSGSLQHDAGGGTGVLGGDAAIPRDGAPATGDAGSGRGDASGIGDAAGGGDAAGVGDAGAGDGMPPAADANCGVLSFAEIRHPTEILVVLDRAIAIAPDRWNNLLAAVAAAIGQNDNSLDWGLYAFPTEGAVCGMASVGTTVDIMPAPDRAIDVVSGLTTASAFTGGTPTAAAIDVAAGYMLSRTTPSPKFLLLVTDGAPTCAGRSGAFSADPTGAQADAIAAVADARAAGVPTIVVAPSTTTDAADVAALNALAVAGGYPLTGEIMFETDATLAALFHPRDAGPCVLMLAVIPQAPDAVTVTFNGAVVPRDPSHVLGWDYTTPSATAIELYGAWCQLEHAEAMWRVEIIFGCPSSD